MKNKCGVEIIVLQKHEKLCHYNQLKHGFQVLEHVFLTVATERSILESCNSQLVLQLYTLYLDLHYAATPLIHSKFPLFLPSKKQWPNPFLLVTPPTPDESLSGAIQTFPSFRALLFAVVSIPPVPIPLQPAEFEPSMAEDYHFPISLKHQYPVREY